MSDINNDDYLLYTLFRKGTSDDPYIEKSEEQQVHNCIVRLSEIPQKQYRVSITSSDNSLWYEIDDGLPESNQYKVNYNTGSIQFSSDNEAKTFTFNYLSVGQILINSERIKISLDQGLNVQDTLQKLIDDNRIDGNLAHRKSPVNTYNDIATTYPLPIKGDMVQTLDTNKMWIWTGQDWYWFYTFPTQQVINLQNNVTDIYNKIGDLSQLPTTDKSSLVNSNKELSSQLAERYTKEESDNKYLINQEENFIIDIFSDEIRDIFLNKLSDFKIRFDLVKNNRFTLGWISDLHYNPFDVFWGAIGDAEKSISHLYNIAQFSSDFDMVMVGGDNADPTRNDSKNPAISFNNHIVTTALTLNQCPTFFGKGNHDDNNIAGMPSGVYPAITNQLQLILQDKDFASIYRQKDLLFGELRNGQSNYFYKDFEDKKVRFIWIDSYDTNEEINVDGSLQQPRNSYSVFSNEQLSWMINNALTLPSSDWNVIIGTHAPLLGTTADQPAANCINHDKMKVIIEAFKNGGSGDLDLGVSIHYNFLASNLIGVVNGHLHQDMIKKISNVNYISCDCSLGCHFDGTKFFDTDQEDAWKAFAIDTVNKKVDVVSFGRGDDFSFSY
jgi:hypothetical protein